MPQAMCKVFLRVWCKASTTFSKRFLFVWKKVEEGYTSSTTLRGDETLDDDNLKVWLNSLTIKIKFVII